MTAVVYDKGQGRVVVHNKLYRDFANKIIESKHPVSVKNFGNEFVTTVAVDF